MPRAARDIAEASPLDRHNRLLLSNVHPQDWRNPEPKGRYHMVVVGAGTAGLVTAMGAAGLGAKVALIERNLLGGDCLNSGCVPSKALIRAAHAAAAARGAEEFGVRPQAGAGAVDFGRVMERMRRLRAGISAHDSARRFRDQGVDVYLGQATFSGDRTVVVGGAELRFSKACIATGTRAAVPPVPGLKDAGALTNENVFTLTELPRRLAVIGAGPIGVEMAQSFARFGSRVTLIESARGILSREDRDAAEVVERSLRRDGVETLFDSAASGVSAVQGETVVSVRSRTGGNETKVRADRLLVAAGRAPNVEGLGLDQAGIHYDVRKGVTVDDRLRTTNRRVYAAGDICSAFKFTHAADAMARIVIRNALFFGRSKASSLNIPWCTYSDPELAHVGLSERDAKAKHVKLDTYRIDMASVDRAVLDGETDGFVKVHCKRGSDSIVGATIVARHAGEMISEITAAMNAGMGMQGLSATIHPYPTRTEAIRKAGDAFQRTRLTPRSRSLLKAVLRFNR